jgi:hypothetical protein
VRSPWLQAPRCQTIVAESVPPWVEFHEGGQDLSPEQDAKARQDYYRELHNAISAGLRREEDDRLPY